jgi:hypothetical protein
MEDGAAAGRVQGGVVGDEGDLDALPHLGPHEFGQPPRGVVPDD